MKLPLIVLAALVCSLPLARASVTVNPAALPKGVTLEKANLLAASLDKVAADQTARDLARIKELRQTLDVIQKPYVDLFNKTVSGNPKYKAGYDDYVAQAKAIFANSALSRKDRAAAITALNDKYKTLFQEIFKVGAIDEATYFSLTRNAAAAHHKKYKPEKRFTYEYAGFLTIAWGETIPTASTPTASETILTKPFPLTLSSGTNGVSSDPAAGNYSIYVPSLFVGFTSSGSGLGHFLTVPAGYRSIEVTVTVRNDFELQASAAGGGSGAEAWTNIRILGENLEKYRSFDHGSVTAPVFWHAAKSGGDFLPFTTTFPAPPANTTLTMSFQSQTAVTVLGAAYAYAYLWTGVSPFQFVGSDIPPIRVRFIP